MTRLTTYARREAERERDCWDKRADKAEAISAALMNVLHNATVGEHDPLVVREVCKWLLPLEEFLHDHVDASAAVFRDRAAEAAEPLGDEEMAERRGDYFAGQMGRMRA